MATTRSQSIMWQLRRFPLLLTYENSVDWEREWGGALCTLWAGQCSYVIALAPYQLCRGGTRTERSRQSCQVAHSVSESHKSGTVGILFGIFWKKKSVFCSVCKNSVPLPTRNELMTLACFRCEIRHVLGAQKWATLTPTECGRGHFGRAEIKVPMATEAQVNYWSVQKKRKKDSDNVPCDFLTLSPLPHILSFLTLCGEERERERRERATYTQVGCTTQGGRKKKRTTKSCFEQSNIAEEQTMHIAKSRNKKKKKKKNWPPTFPSFCGHFLVMLPAALFAKSGVPCSLL